MLQDYSPHTKALGNYIKQLGELKLLHENGILTGEEYKEQREELVQLMRQLKK